MYIKREVLEMVEAALGENLQFITDLADLRLRQKDAETLRRLQQLSDAWVTVVKLLYEGEYVN
jgi:hypothetical protein